MPQRVLIVGGGPAGLAAATAIGDRAQVVLFEQKASAGRKFLVAGKGGLNLTNAEPLDAFLGRYGAAATRLAPFLRAHDPGELTRLAVDLTGKPAFTGSSGRVFPAEAKAAPLLRAWIARLRRAGVEFHTRRSFTGFAATDRGVALRFRDSGGAESIEHAGAAVLALGGASWPETGSTGAWVAILRAAGIEIADLAASNVGVEVDWSKEFLSACEGKPLKNIALSFAGTRARGDAVVTGYGLEGTPVYRLNAALRGALPAVVEADLAPDKDVASITNALGRDAKKSLPDRLRAAAGLSKTAMALLRTRPRDASESAGDIAARVKAFPLTVRALRPIGEAISSAGGIRFSEVDGSLMLTKLPGIFVAGEMLDWDAPTGGYLLQAAYATGSAAGEAAARWSARPLG